MATSKLATSASSKTKAPATGGGLVRRLYHDRSIIAAARRHATSSAARPNRSCWLIAEGRSGSGARRSPSSDDRSSGHRDRLGAQARLGPHVDLVKLLLRQPVRPGQLTEVGADDRQRKPNGDRSEEHTSELQSPDHLVCRLLLEKNNRY